MKKIRLFLFLNLVVLLGSYAQPIKRTEYFIEFEGGKRAQFSYIKNCFGPGKDLTTNTSGGLRKQQRREIVKQIDSFFEAYDAYESYKKILQEPICQEQQIDRLRIRGIMLNNMVKLAHALQPYWDAFQRMGIANFGRKLGVFRGVCCEVLKKERSYYKIKFEENNKKYNKRVECELLAKKYEQEGETDGGDADETSCVDETSFFE
ncbi:MAG: hypothetical protein ABH827_03635 [bacterium]